MEKFESESELPDSSSPISEPPDITNWFSGYVYESFPLCSLAEEGESESEFPVEGDKENLDVSVTDHNKEKFVSNKDHHKIISDRNVYDSLPSEPPDVSNWFLSYVYESLMLDTSHGLEFSVPGDSEECLKETEIDKEATDVDRNGVCPRLTEKELVFSAKVTDYSQSQSLLSEPPDVRNWFSSYEYQSPQLSDTRELGFAAFEKDQLIIEESDTEEENSSGIFRKTKSKQETVALGRLNSDDYKENIAEETAKEISSDNANSDQEIERESLVRLFSASTKEVKQESIFKQEPLVSGPKQEPTFSPIASQYSPSKKEASLDEQRPKHIQETISLNSNRLNSPKALREEDFESTEHESDDKENVHGESTETGFVTMKKARFREARKRCSMAKPNTGGVLVGCSRSKEFTEEEDKEERKKKRRVLVEMSNHQFPKAEEIAGKWRCPQKNKGNSVPPLKQLRLDTWIHKV